MQNNLPVITLKDHIEYSDGAIVSKIVHKVPNGHLTLFAFDEGQKIDEHTAPFDAVVSIVEGKGEVTIAGTPYQLNAGQYIIMPANIPHAVKSMGKMKMLLTMIRSS